jgi:hypothetical protein
MKNNEYQLKQGASGAVITVTLYDANGIVDLTGYTSIKMTARKGGATPVLDHIVMTINPDPTTGKASYAFDATTSNIAVGQYSLEFKATDPTGDVQYFPVNKQKKYGILTVLKTLE